MFEQYLDRYLCAGDQVNNKIYCVDVFKSLQTGTAYVTAVWNPSADFKWDTTQSPNNVAEPSTGPIGFGPGERNEDTIRAVFSDKDYKKYSRSTTPLLSTTVVLPNIPTGMYYGATDSELWYTTGNSIIRANVNTGVTVATALIQKKNNSGNWVTYTYNPTGIIEDKLTGFWICSQSLGRISKLEKSLRNVSTTDFPSQGGRVNYEEELHDPDTGALLHPTGLCALSGKGTSPSNDVPNVGRFWVTCDNGNIYEIQVDLLDTGIEVSQSMTSQLLTVYGVADE